MISLKLEKKDLFSSFLFHCCDVGDQTLVCSGCLPHTELHSSSNRWPVRLHSDKRCMTTVLYLFLFLLRLIKPLTLSKATAVSKSQQLSRRDPLLSGGPCESCISTKGGSKSVQCPVHSPAPLPPGGRSMQVFPESWALCLA